MGFVIQKTCLDQLLVMESKTLFDNRGSFSRIFCENELEWIMKDRKLKQINFSINKNIGTVRGLHFQQAPYGELKIVKCVHGAIWDVAVDIRKDSPTFLKWHSQKLSADNALAMIIPEGFAHGFQTLEKDTKIVYFHSESYNADAQFGLNVQDRNLSINWPLPITNISKRDRDLPYIKPDFEGYSNEL